ncbi:MAG: tRNA pseudouridine(55) synthase TruB [Synergistaceae bacterium]|nr:tRNA pseudouridine(55) synthase TruB [Synergistaceae bacterium]
MNNALVLLNKPVDMRSTACVSRAKKQLDGLKVGHCGTLDSTASGLLILVTGDATRFSDYVMLLPKVYRARIQFGAETDTCDYSGDVTFRSDKDFAELDTDKLNDALYSFSGLRLQSPPPISAVKIDGKPAYKLARSGRELEIKKRPVYFRQVKVLSPYDKVTGTLELEIHCGKGTYIRSLAQDLGKITGFGAYLLSLERVSIGNFNLTQANDIDSDYRFTGLSELARNFTGIYVSDKDSKSFTNGMSILLRNAERLSRGVTPMSNIICVEGSDFLGIGSYAGYDYVRPLVIVKKY